MAIKKGVLRGKVLFVTSFTVWATFRELWVLLVVNPL
jgi:hypothetical protein